LNVDENQFRMETKNEMQLNISQAYRNLAIGEIREPHISQRVIKSLVVLLKM
jgi:hypothetical protein